MTSVARSHRFSPASPCPVCGGDEQAPRGRGERCFGFASSDGQWVHCTRAEFAGSLPFNAGTQAYAHRLYKACRCGVEHQAAPPNFNGSRQTEKPGVMDTTCYPLVDAAGNLVAEHMREDLADGTKRMWWQRNGKPGLDGLRTEDLPLYGLLDLLAAAPDQEVVITEGQKARDALAARGILAVGTVTGAKGTPSLDTLRPLVGHPLGIWPDNDEDGRTHMERIASQLRELGVTEGIIDWPDAPPKGDAWDFFSGGGSVEALREMLKAALELGSVTDALPEDEEPGWRERPTTVKEGASLVPSLGMRRLADVVPEEVDWLWPGRIPRGKLTMFAGDPGVGKSILSLDIAARVSCGSQWPTGGEVPQGNVLLISAEDGVGDTIRPRLDLHGADVAHVFALDLTVDDGDGNVSGLLLSMASHLALIELRIVETKAALVIIDPLLAFTGRVNTHKNAEVRGLLMPLSALAERTNAAIVGIMHLNQDSNESNAIYRVSSSLAFVAAARSAFLVAEDRDDPSSRLFVSIKANLTAPSPALRFHFTTQGALVWDGEAKGVAIASLLASPVRESDRGGRFGEAKDFLWELLSSGAMPARQGHEEAKEAGFTEATLRRALEAMQVRVYRESVGNKGDGRWMWVLAQQDAQRDGDGAPDHKDSHDEHLAKVAPKTGLDVASLQGAHAPQYDEVLGVDEHLASQIGPVDEKPQDAQGAHPGGDGWREEL